MFSHRPLWPTLMLAMTALAHGTRQDAKALVGIENRAPPSSEASYITQTLQVTAILAPLPTGSTSMLVTASPTTSATSGVQVVQASIAATNSSTSHRNLTIVLSSVFGVLGLVLLAIGACMCQRYRRGARFWKRRSASPIGDDEIASWRGTMIDKRSSDRLTIDTRVRGMSSASLAGSPPGTWDSPAPSIGTAFPLPVHYPATSSLFAHAPNARVGLTDEVVPGDDPFIMPPQRQSTRLSKSHPGHVRTKSRRSSASGASMWSFRSRNGESKDCEATWYDPEDNLTARELPAGTPRLSSSRGTSSTDSSPKGLAPRPSQR